MGHKCNFAFFAFYFLSPRLRSHSCALDLPPGYLQTISELCRLPEGAPGPLGNGQAQCPQKLSKILTLSKVPRNIHRSCLLAIVLSNAQILVGILYNVGLDEVQLKKNTCYHKRLFI
jgi:hypothetical protein